MQIKFDTVCTDIKSLLEYYRDMVQCSLGCLYCIRLKQKCTIKCQCLGSCTNSNKISDTLFFKVWRCKVLRNKITGEERIQKIKSKNDVMDVVIENLYYYKIEYDRNFIFNEIKKLNNIQDIMTEADKIVQPFFLKKMDDKKNQLIQGTFCEKGILRLKSPRVKQYIENIDPIIEERLPTLDEIIKQEKQEIETIIKNIVLIFELQDIQYQGINTNINRFILDGSENYEKLISDEIHLCKEQKEEKLQNALTFYNIIKPKFQSEIEKYLNTYRMSEIQSNNIWSHNKIICEERYNYHKENESTIRVIKVIEKLNKLNLPYRENSELIKIYKNISKPKEYFNRNYFEDGCEDYEDDLLFDNELSINDVIQNENETIKSIIKKLEFQYQLHGFQFNISSDIVQSFICGTSDINSEDFNRQLKILLSIEESFQMKTQYDEFKNQLKIHGIHNPLYPEQHNKYLNSLCQLRNRNYQYLNDNIWSPETIILKELEAKSRLNYLIISLSKLGITYQYNGKNRLINHYIYNRDETGNELSMENSNSLFNEIIRKEKELEEEKEKEEEKEEHVEYDYFDNGYNEEEEEDIYDSEQDMVTDSDYENY
ncbi:hypothetical protein ACTFIV_010336 [Dictyostelium citrinum]